MYNTSLDDANILLHMLKDARVLISKGWTQGVLIRNDCEYCTVGAIAKARQDLGAPYHLQIRALRTFEDKTGEMFVSSWNDKIGRTQQEVLALFDDAIQYWDSYIANLDS